MRFQHWKLFHSKSNCCIKHPQKSSETYLFYGTVHLMKKSEICNLLNKTSLCFQSLFMMITFIIKISCTAGFTRWVDLYRIYNKDKELKNNFKKPPEIISFSTTIWKKQTECRISTSSLTRNNNYGSSKLLSKSKRCCQFFWNF